MGSAEQFEELIGEALDSLPAWVQERLENIEVLVEDEAPPDQPTLLGLYEGIPLPDRGMFYSGVLPDRITLFRRNLERHARSDAELRESVAHTVLHEIAHFFGITDDRLRELDRY